jgi:hypothetical protein
MRPTPLVVALLLVGCSVVCSVAGSVARAAAARADEAPASPAPYGQQNEAPPRATDEILWRVLRSGCRDGLPDVQALAANGAVPWAEPVARMCAQVLAAAPAPELTFAPPRPKHDGRGAMVIASTLYGIWAGVATDVLFTIDGPRSAIAAPLVGMATGLGLSLALTGDHPLDGGQAWTIITGLEFGSVDGALWGGGLDASSKDVVGTTLAVGLASGALGLVVANALDPPQGDVEVIRSGLTWGTLTGLLGMAALSTNDRSQSYLRGAAVSMDLGFLAGLAIAASFDVSRNRDLIVDAGTLGGGVAGLGLSWLFVAGPNASARPVFAGTLAGMYAGMLITIYATRGMAPDDDERTPTVAALWGRDARGRWRLGSPAATPVLDGLGHRVIGVSFDALGGVF